MSTTGTTALVGHSPAMEDVLRQVSLVRDSAAPVLIHGEPGTGRETIAREIHRSGARAQAAFVLVDCASAPPEVLEQVLFCKGPEGAFKKAARGTLLLKEVARLSPDHQERLLRYLKDGAVTCTDGSEVFSPDVRIVASSTTSLREAVEEQGFRQDLFYRFNLFQIDLPPLRERREDVLALTQCFLVRSREQLTGNANTMTPRALESLRRYSWPGNLRELENAIFGAVMAAGGAEVIDFDSLPETVRAVAPAPEASSSPLPMMAEEEERILPLEELERRAITHALRVTRGNVTRAARALGIGRATLYRKLERFRINTR